MEHAHNVFWQLYIFICQSCIQLVAYLTQIEYHLILTLLYISFWQKIRKSM
jgi:hypothetical protein